MVIAADGEKRRHGFHRVMMRSRAKLAYAQAQAAIDGRPDDATGPLLETALRPLWAAYAALRAARDRRGPLALDLPERKVLLSPEGAVDRVIVPERLDAHRLIEEFMIQANVAAAETLEQARQPLIYRVHDEPALEKMRALGEVLASVGIKLPKEGALRPALFNRILATAAETEHGVFLNEVILRSQAQAVYAPENLGHFGLNLRRYAHFTSPIRRYADLIVHRALITACRLGSDGLASDVSSASWRRSASRSRRPSAAPWRPSARRSTGSSPTTSPTRSARPSRARSPASPGPACSSSSTRPARTASCRSRSSAPTISATRRAATPWWASAPGRRSASATGSKCGSWRPHRWPGRCASSCSARAGPAPVAGLPGPARRPAAGPSRPRRPAAPRHPQHRVAPPRLAPLTRAV